MKANRKRSLNKYSPRSNPMSNLINVLKQKCPKKQNNNMKIVQSIDRALKSEATEIEVKNTES